MPDAKPKSIPQWQRQGAIPPSSTDSDENNSASKTTEEEPSSRATLLEQAAKFLEHEEICDASREQKVAFLEGKGLRRDEIDDLLGMLPDEDGVSKDMPTKTATRSEVGILPTNSRSVNMLTVFRLCRVQQRIRRSPAYRLLEQRNRPPYPQSSPTPSFSFICSVLHL